MNLVSRFRIKQFYEYGIIIFASVFITIGFLRFNESRKNNVITSTSSKNEKITIQISESDYKDEFINSIKSAFEVYDKFCASYDEVSPISHQCSNSFGFYATALESLETFYLFGLNTQFQKVKKIIQNKLSPDSVKWVNRNDFWTRAIGSFIGTYLLTKDRFFLDLATQFTDRLLVLQQKSPKYSDYVNFATNSVRSASWKNQTISISDLIVGLPELTALSVITKNTKYSMAIQSIIRSIPDFKEYPPSFIYLPTMESSPYEFNRYFSGHTSGFLYSLAASQAIFPRESVKTILSKIPKDLSRQKFDTSTSSILLEFSRLMESFGLEINFGRFIDNLVNDFKDLKFASTSNDRSIIGFHFDSSVLRYLLHSDQSDTVSQLILRSLDSFAYGKGYNGLQKSSTNRLVNSTIQDSAFFGQWMKAAGESLLSQEPVIFNAVSNEKGHYLKLGV